MQTSASRIVSRALGALLAGTLAGQTAAEITAQWELTTSTTMKWPQGQDGPNEKDTTTTAQTLQSNLIGDLVAIGHKSVAFQPLLGDPASPTALPLDRVSSLRKISPETPPPSGESSNEELSKDSDASESNETTRIVNFRRGSNLPARLIRLSPDGLVLALGKESGIGHLTVPLGEIRSIVPSHKKADSAGRLPSANGRHVARLKTGEVIIGNISPLHGERDRLKITSPILTGEFPLSLVDEWHFPDEPSSTKLTGEEEENEPLRRVAIVSFGDRISLTSESITLSNGVLSLELWEGAPLQVPLTEIESIHFVNRGGIRPSGPVLLWGAHADLGDEFKKTKAALQGDTRRELIVLEGSDTDDPAFEAALQRSSTLVWAEWERFEGDKFTAALDGKTMRPLAEQLQTFVEAGGIFVLLGLSAENARHFGKLGFGEVISPGSFSDGATLKLTGPGEAFATVIEGDVEATNSTMRYTFEGGGAWTPFLVDPDNATHAALAGRRAGNGWLFLLGMDLFEQNEAIVKILHELTNYRR